MTAFYDLSSPTNQALTEYIRQAIVSNDSQISFCQFMELALYHPEWGYYNSESFEFGKNGDFTTAPEISPLFSRCFGRQCRQILNYLGEGQILELGAGSGRFAKDLLLELEKLGNLPEHYYIYEISPALRKKQQQILQAACPHLFNRVIWLEIMPAHFTGLVIANELLDALPVYCFRIEEHGMKERRVGFEKGQFIWRAGNPTEELAEKATKIRELYALNPGYESEINLRLPALIHSLANILTQGVMFFADYGYGQREYYHPDRQKGTLTCYYRHRMHADPFILVGLQDITAHVDFTHVIETAVANDCQLGGYTTQAAFLFSLGLAELAEQEAKHFSSIEQYQQAQAIKLLTLPSEMGERIKVMALTKNFESPLLGFALQERRQDL